jgi:hypothetical protein
MTKLENKAMITLSENPTKFAVADVEDGVIVGPIIPINIEDLLPGRIVLIRNSGPGTISVRPVGESVKTMGPGTVSFVDIPFPVTIGVVEGTYAEIGLELLSDGTTGKANRLIGASNS